MYEKHKCSRFRIPFMKFIWSTQFLKKLILFASGGRLWASGGSVQGCTRAHTEDLDIAGQDIYYFCKSILVEFNLWICLIY